jgi:parvulin-like peptidyl-prolyl isomerase
MKKLSLLFGIFLTSLVFAQESKPVLSVNGEEIGTQEYLRRMEYLPGLGKSNVKGELVEILPGIATIDALVTEKLILQAAKAKNVFPTDAEVDAEIQFRLKKNPNTLLIWKATGRTEAEYRKLTQVEVAQYKLQTMGVTVTDKDIKELYELSKESRYTISKRYKLRVISVRSEAEKAKVEEGLKSGKSFAALAALHSTDPSSKEGGLFGVVPVEVLSDSVKLQVSKLKAGERTPWIAGGDGVQATFLAEEITPESIIPLNDAIKEDIRRELALRRGGFKNDINKLIKEMRSKADIKITSPEFDKAYKQMIGLANKVNG